MSDRPTHFFRIVATNPPTLWDFTSLQGRGRDLQFPTPEALRLWGGLSVFETIGQAQEQRRRYPYLGRFVAELALPSNVSVRGERTTRTPGHWTLWAPPATLLACVTVVTSM